MDCTLEMMAEEGWVGKLESDADNMGSLEFALAATSVKTAPEAHPMVVCKK